MSKLLLLAGNPALPAFEARSYSAVEARAYSAYSGCVSLDTSAASFTYNLAQSDPPTCSATCGDEYEYVAIQAQFCFCFPSPPDIYATFNDSDCSINCDYPYQDESCGGVTSGTLIDLYSFYAGSDISLPGAPSDTSAGSSGINSPTASVQDPSPSEQPYTPIGPTTTDQPSPATPAPSNAATNQASSLTDLVGTNGASPSAVYTSIPGVGGATVSTRVPHFTCTDKTAVHSTGAVSLGSVSGVGDPTVSAAGTPTEATQADPTTGATQADPTTGATQADPTTGATQTDPTIGATQADPTTGATQDDPTTVAPQVDPTTIAPQAGPTTVAPQGVSTITVTLWTTVTSYTTVYPSGPLTTTVLSFPAGTTRITAGLFTSSRSAATVTSTCHDGSVVTSVVPGTVQVVTYDPYVSELIETEVEGGATRTVLAAVVPVESAAAGKVRQVMDSGPSLSMPKAENESTTTTTQNGQWTLAVSALSGSLTGTGWVVTPSGSQVVNATATASQFPITAGAARCGLGWQDSMMVPVLAVVIGILCF